MTPDVDRTPRIRRRLKKLGLPDLQIPSGATNKRELARAEATVDALIADRQVGVLRALMAGPTTGGVTLAQLIDVRRAGQLSGSGILATVAMRENVWTAAGRLFGTTGKASATKQRYAVAIGALRRKAARWLPADATLADLALVPWPELAAGWNASGSDWNNMRRAVSRLLTLALGDDKYHQARRDVMKLIPRRPEAVRVPDLTPALFQRIVEAARADVQPAFVTLLLTGMRVRTEYLRCTRDHLMPHTCGVQVPATKNEASRATVRVAEEHWPWVDAAIPAPLKYKALRRHWMLACDAVGAGTYTVTVDPDTKRRAEHYIGLTLHALRHAHGQFPADQGVPLIHVKASMRHATLSQTEKYARQAAKGEVAAALGKSVRRKGA